MVDTENAANKLSTQIERIIICQSKSILFEVSFQFFLQEKNKGNSFKNSNDDRNLGKLVLGLRKFSIARNVI